MDSIKSYIPHVSHLKYIELDRSIVTKILLGSMCSLSVIYIGSILNSYQYFKRRGIKTPKYSFIFGNFLQLGKKKNQSEAVQEWSKELGPTYGIYQGHVPVLITSDLEIIQEVFIKQFNNFSARMILPLETNENHPVKSLIRAAKGRWKRMRVIMNPTFSNSKLKEMGPLIVKCTDRLIEQLHKNPEVEINFSNYLKRFTMDSIWNCAFGLDIDLQNNPDNLYFKNSENVFKETTQLRLIPFLSIIFNEFNSILLFLYNILNSFQYLFSGKHLSSWRWLLSEVGYLLNRRSLEGVNKRDYMQLLLEAQAQASSNKNGTYDLDKKDLDTLSGLHIEKFLTNEEVKDNLVLFMLAGYETTSTALSYCTYVLATNQEEQQKVFEEINSYFYDSDVKPNTENVKDLAYLEKFITEVLRVYPIARTIRRCVNETTIKGINMKPGMLVRADHLTIHADEKLWGPTDPNIFDPSRHDVKRNPLAFLAFGLGPRNCIGMKFALVEMKLALVNILREFMILKSENTPDKLEFIEGIVRSPKYGVPVVFKKRV